jgi:hypothetical protein
LIRHTGIVVFCESTSGAKKHQWSQKAPMEPKSGSPILIPTSILAISQSRPKKHQWSHSRKIYLFRYYFSVNSFSVLFRHYQSIGLTTSFFLIETHFHRTSAGLPLKRTSYAENPEVRRKSGGSGQTKRLSAHM